MGTRGQKWWANLTTEEKDAFIAKKERSRKDAPVNDYVFPEGTELELTDEVKARIEANMKAKGLERYLVWHPILK